MKRIAAIAAVLACVCASAWAANVLYPINLDGAPTTFMTPHGLVVSASKQGAKSLTDLGTTSKVLCGNASGDPTWCQADLTTQVNGILPVANGGTGASTASGARTNLGALASASPSFTGSMTGGSGSTITLPSGGFFSQGNNSTSHGSAGGFNVDGADSKYRTMTWSTAGSEVWDIGTDNTAQSSTRTGNNFEICEYNNSATFLDCPLKISRATGIVEFVDGLTQSGNAVIDVSSVGTSGHKFGYLDGNNTVSGTNTFSGANTFTASNTFTSSLISTADWYLNSRLTPTSITSTQNNYSPAGCGTVAVLRVSATAAGYEITGLNCGNTAGHILYIQNSGSYYIVIDELSGASSAANQFELGTVANMKLQPGQTMQFWYDGANNYWLRVGGSQISYPDVAGHIGGILEGNCASLSQYVQGYDYNGNPICNQVLFSQLGSTPTTVSGYGITDATIAAGTLGYVDLPVLTQFDKTNTTIVSVTGIGITAAASGIYHFRGTLFVTDDATGGLKIRMGGSLTVTSIEYIVTLTCLSTGATISTTDLTDITTVVTYSAGCTNVRVTIEGVVQANASGTFVPQFAQLSSSGTSSVRVNSQMSYTKQN